MAAELQQNSTIKIHINTNNLIPNSTNLSHRQHCLPVSFNNFIFNSTISSQHQLHQLLNFNIVISLKSTEKINSKKKILLLDKHFLMSKFQLPKTCQDQRLKVRVNNLCYLTIAPVRHLAKRQIQFSPDSLGRNGPARTQFVDTDFFVVDTNFESLILTGFRQLKFGREKVFIQQQIFFFFGVDFFC